MRTNTAGEGTRQGLVQLAARAARRFGLPVAACSAAGSKDARYDLHALIELVERGCPPELAVRILAPLDDEAAA